MSTRAEVRYKQHAWVFGYDVTPAGMKLAPTQLCSRCGVRGPLPGGITTCLQVAEFIPLPPSPGERTWLDPWPWP